ncbi:MAG TPA: GNAT family N-acetyltransferase, partial [Nitriliruptorales bacterium]
MVEFRPMADDDVEQILAMREAAFGLPRLPEDAERSLDGEYHVIADGAEVLGVLRVYRWSQWFGGNRVPTAGVASVTVAPKARGRGTGRDLMARTLTLLRDEGVPLSTLYPSTAAPYRRAGYELAGARVRYSLRVGDLPTHLSGDVDAWGDDDLDDVRACYDRFAAATNGMLDRSEGAWRNAVLAPSGDRSAFRYLVREDGEVTGYLVYSQETDSGRMPFRYVRGDTPYNYQLACRDLVTTTPEAGRRLLAFLAGHRAMATNVLWTGPPNDPLDVLFPALYGM